VVFRTPPVEARHQSLMSRELTDWAYTNTKHTLNISQHSYRYHIVSLHHAHFHSDNVICHAKPVSSSDNTHCYVAFYCHHGIRKTSQFLCKSQPYRMNEGWLYFSYAEFVVHHCRKTTRIPGDPKKLHIKGDKVIEFMTLP
jgi:hypothetical protein